MKYIISIKTDRSSGLRVRVAFHRSLISVRVHERISTRPWPFRDANTTPEQSFHFVLQNYSLTSLNEIARYLRSLLFTWCVDLYICNEVYLMQWSGGTSQCFWKDWRVLGWRWEGCVSRHWFLLPQACKLHSLAYGLDAIYDSPRLSPRPLKSKTYSSI